MTVSKRSFLAVFTLVAASSALVFSLQAGASRGHHEEHGKVFRSGLVGNLLTDPPIHGSPKPGGMGDRQEQRDAQPERQVRPARQGSRAHEHGDDGTVTTITASFFCAPDSNTVAAFVAGPDRSPQTATRAFTRTSPCLRGAWRRSCSCTRTAAAPATSL